MLDYVIINKHEGSVYTMTICIIALAAYWLTRSDVSTVCDLWSEILTEISSWCLTTILHLHATAWSNNIIVYQTLFVNI